MAGFVVKSIARNLIYHQQRVNANGLPIKDGLLCNVVNGVVYWHWSNNGYPRCFESVVDAQLVIDFFRTQPDIFYDEFQILDCDNPTIHFSLIKIDYDIELPTFGVNFGMDLYTLPFDIIGKRARID